MALKRWKGRLNFEITAQFQLHKSLWFYSEWRASLTPFDLIFLSFSTFSPNPRKWFACEALVDRLCSRLMRLIAFRQQPEALLQLAPALFVVLRAARIGT
jgi:hypothetical protein